LSPDMLRFALLVRRLMLLVLMAVEMHCKVGDVDSVQLTRR
jgi:hypothetical protein